MGAMWCKVDKGQARSFGPKEPFNSTISRWTNHVRQAYRKPKTHHRPPRPPQKPLRSNDRLIIGNPQLLKEDSSDGWRTATLMVPDTAPVPPPRKKRKRNQDLARTAYSMDDLDRVEPFNKSTISLPDKYHSESGLDSRSSSSTMIVTPVLESRIHHEIDNNEDNKENIKSSVEIKIEEDDDNEEENEDSFVPDEIIPIEKETLFSCKTLLHSNLGYIDKLSAISEVSTESGFDDKTDIIKSSERSESVTSSESIPRETGLNILAHIHNINNVSQINDTNHEIREKTAISKTEWLQNILKEESEPYFISKDSFKDSRRGSDSMVLDSKPTENFHQPNSLPTDHLHLMNRDVESPIGDNYVNKTPPPTPELRSNPCSTGNNHSVLLELLQKNSTAEVNNDPPNPFIHKEESIFLTNTKTNIIYKSLSSDKLTDDYDVDFLCRRETEPSHLINLQGDVLKSCPLSEGHGALESTNPFNDLTSKSHLSDYSFQTPKLVESDVGLNSLLQEKRSNVVSSFDFKEIMNSQNYVTALKDLRLSGEKPPSDVDHCVVVNGGDATPLGSPSENKNIIEKDNKDDDNKLNVNEKLENKNSVSSSRRSSITDSLHEFEMSIYDMLKESKKYRDSSDEDDSLKIAKD